MQKFILAICFLLIGNIAVANEEILERAQKDTAAVAEALVKTLPSQFNDVEIPIPAENVVCQITRPKQANCELILSYDGPGGSWDRKLVATYEIMYVPAPNSTDLFLESVEIQAH